MIVFRLKWHNSLIYGHERPTAARTQRQGLRMIGVLIFPDFQLLDAAGPISVFDIAGRFARDTTQIRVIAEKAGPMRSSSGVEMMARKFGPAGAITTLIIAGGDGVEAAAHNKCTIRFVQNVAKRGTRV